MNSARLFLLTLTISIFLSSLSFATPGFLNNSCGVINESGTYIANVSNLTSQTAYTCINITASNVLLNLNGSRVDRALSSSPSIYVFSGLTNITIANGTINNSFQGIEFNGVENSTVRNLSIHSISDCSGILLQNNSRYNSITNITVYNAFGSCSIANGDGNGVYLLNSSHNNITNSIFYNLTKGIYAYDVLAHNNTISGNTIYNTNHSGILLDSTLDNTISYNYIHDALDTDNGQGYGIFLLNIGGDDGGLTTVSNNNLSSMSRCFKFFYPGFAAISLNKCDNSEYGFEINADMGGGSYQNNAITNVSFGFAMLPSDNPGPTYAATNQIQNFSGNNMTNATEAAIVLVNSTLIFSGNNGIYSLTEGSLEIGMLNESNSLLGGNLSTDDYNITTNYLSFQLDAYNVSVSVVNLSDTPGTTVSSISGVSTSYDSLIPFSTGYFGLNITNASGVAGISPKLFYNSSALGSYSTSYLGIGSTSGGGTWTFYSGTVNPSESSVYYSSITSFSYFTVIAYAPSTPASSSSTEDSLLSFNYSFECSTGMLTVTSSVDNVRITLSELMAPFSSQERTTQNMVALFTIAKSAGYKLTAEKPGYLTLRKTNLDFGLCNLVVDDTPSVDDAIIVAEPSESPLSPDSNQITGEAPAEAVPEGQATSQPNEEVPVSVQPDLSACEGHALGETWSVSDECNSCTYECKLGSDGKARSVMGACSERYCPPPNSSLPLFLLAFIALVIVGALLFFVLKRRKKAEN